MFMFYYINTLKLSTEEMMSLLVITLGLLLALILFLYLRRK